MTKAPPKVEIVQAHGNWIDRAISYFDPKRGAQRMKSRAVMALAESDFYLQNRRAERGLLGNWRPRPTGPNETQQQEHEDIRARSRELIRTDPIAAGAVHTNVAHVIGTGLTMKPAIDASRLGMTVEQAKKWQDDVAGRFLSWAESPNADAGGRLDFYDLQALALRSVLASGDVFPMLPQVEIPGWPYRLAVQLIEADRVSNENRVQDKVGELVAGVVLDRSGRAVGYHVADQHPGSVGKAKWTKVAAIGATGRRNMLHLYDLQRPDQVRGIPYLGVVVEKLKELSRYAEAELHAAVTAAAMTVFTRMDSTAFQEVFDEAAQTEIVQRGMGWDGVVKPGMTVNLLPGEEVEIPENKRPNVNFDPFFLAIVRQIGVGLELPFEVLIKHFTSSYSASRAAMLDAWRTFRRRRDWMAKRFCQPIYEEWLADEVAFGRVAAPGFFADPMTRWAYSQAQWIGDGPGSIDPQKEVAAAIERITSGISTLEAESILHDGIGWEQKHAQRVIEVTARRGAGLEMDPTAVQAAPSGPPSNGGDDDE